MQFARIAPIIIFLLTANFAAFSQDFYANGTEWQYGINGYYSGPAYPTLQRIRITGDTIIDGKFCKIFTKKYLDCNRMYSYEDYLHIENGEWRFFNEENQEFQLLYNFNLLAGDTMSFRLWNPMGLTTKRLHYRVDSIKIALVGDTELKRFFCTYGSRDHQTGEMMYYNDFPEDSFEMVENIGHMENMFFFWDTGSCHGLWVNKFHCYTNPTIGTYVAESAVCTDELVSVRPLTAEDGITIYPNPVQDRLHYQSVDRLISFSLFDLAGKLVLDATQVIRREDIIDLSALASGVYLLRIRKEDGGVVVAKVVKR